MATIAENLLPIIVDQVNKFGDTLTLKKITIGTTYNPSTGTYPTTSVDYPIKAGVSVANAKDVTGANALNGNGTSLLMGDLLITATSTEVAPIINDLLVYKSNQYSITSVSPLSFQDTILAYEMTARR